MNQEEINELIDDSVPNWRWLQIQAERERKAEELGPIQEAPLPRLISSSPLYSLLISLFSPSNEVKKREKPISILPPVPTH